MNGHTKWIVGVVSASLLLIVGWAANSVVTEAHEAKDMAITNRQEIAVAKVRTDAQYSEILIRLEEIQKSLEAKK